MNYSYKTSGTCSHMVNFAIDNGILHNVEFFGGCNGNLKAIGKLVEGKNATEVRDILLGNTCGFKGTSCGDQLARAIDHALSQQHA